MYPDNQKKIVIGLVITIIIIVSVVLILVFNNSDNIQLSPDLKCNTLNYNGENKINLVFFSTKQQAESYSNYLLDSTPFNSHKTNFNIYYIDYSPECELYQGKGILCYNSNVIKAASLCPNDFIIAIKTEPKKIKSTAYMNVVSLNSNHPNSVILHEFGHVFANLADEYVGSIIPSGSKNCQNNCNEFKQYTNDCYQGCSEQDYYRSIEQGVMKSLKTTDYGKYNLNLIASKILSSSSITGHAVSDSQDCSNNNYYLIRGINSNNEFNVLSQTVEQGCVGTNGVGGYEYNLLREDGKIIQSDDFNPELIYLDSQEDTQQEIEGGTSISDREFYLKVPIIEDATTIEISDGTQTISQINLQTPDNRPCLI